MSDQDRVLLTVGALTSCKGHRCLLNAMPRVIQEFPRVQAVLAGSGELEGELRQQADELNIAKNVQFLGQRSDIPDLTRAADLFVMPSLAEGLGSAVIEAMFGDCPVVASAVGGIPELLGPRTAGEPPVGWCVPPGDSHSLAEAILESLSNETIRRQRAIRARQRAEGEFVAEKMVESTLNVYQELLKSPKVYAHTRREHGERVA